MMNLRRAWGQSKKKNASLGHHSEILILQSRKRKGKHNPLYNDVNATRAVIGRCL